MPKYYKLDKRIASGTTYTQERDKFLVIKEVGTDSTSEGTLYVASAPCLKIKQDIAGLVKTSSNKNGLLKLGDLYIVVPQTKSIKFSGASGSYCRIKGLIGELGPGEALPGNHAARFEKQHKHYVTYVDGSETKSAGTSITAGTIVDLIEQTVPAGEKWTLRRLFMAEAKLDDGTNVANFASRIKVNDYPLDTGDAADLHKGILSPFAPQPARSSVNERPFSLEETPIILNEGDTLKVEMICTSDYTVPTGKTLYLVATVVVEKER